MKKLLVPIALALSFLSAPSHAAGCDIPFKLAGIDYKKTLSYKVIVVKTADANKVSAKYEIGTTDFKEVEKYIKTESKGKTKIKFSFESKVFTLPGTVASYPIGMPGIENWEEAERRFLSDAISASDPSVNYSKSDGVIIIPDSTFFSLALAFDQPITADGKNLYAVAFNMGSPYSLAHEIMHNLGLRDLYLHDGGYPVEGYSLMSMAFAGGPLLQYEKHLLGWISEKDKICHISGTLETPLSSDSKRLIMVPLSPIELLAIQPLGSRVLIYSINSSIPNGYGPISIISNLKSNKSFTYKSITIKHMGKKVGVYN
jgi:M6 family metalloprotease-like protein